MIPTRLFEEWFFKSHHCPPIKMSPRELSRLCEAVNWWVEKHIDKQALNEAIKKKDEEKKSNER